ncbi:hypothetical protein ILUMI_08629 [Ignelater luminosus]|uniref:Reverse transcriptase domain-containing protein n=1 Tax=Ignelater luminosus TaxID=2038154 RepID=A0A8K0D6J2_IGNLU|nr:hypothetical protein ILUMI_08629 [Ignelater luminosus]
MIGYADDVALLIRGQKGDQLRTRANTVLRQLNNWLERNKLELAPQKTEAVILVGRNSIKELVVEMDKDRVTTMEALKYFEVWNYVGRGPTEARDKNRAVLQDSID